MFKFIYIILKLYKNVKLSRYKQKNDNTSTLNYPNILKRQILKRRTIAFNNLKMLSILMNIHEYNKQQTQREQLSLFKLIFYVCYKKHTNSLQANLGQVNIKCSKKGQDKKLFSLRYILLNSVVIRHSSAESDSAVSMKSLSLTLWCQ